MTRLMLHLKNMTVANHFTTQQASEYSPSLGNELAIGFRNVVVALISIQSYWKKDLQLESAYEQLKNCFVAIIIVFDAANYIKYCKSPELSGVTASRVSEALRDVHRHSIFLEQKLEYLRSISLTNAMAKNPRAIPVPPQPQWTGPNNVLARSGRVESTPMPPQPQWTAPAELMARLERVEAALGLSMSRSGGTPISQSIVQDAMVETKAWVIRSTDTMSMQSGMSRGEADVHVVHSSY